MDISESSNSSCAENSNESQVLRLANPLTSSILDNEVLDNKKYNENNTSTSNISSNNATNFHPLMFSPTSPISPDFPDLIPERPKLKLATHDKHFSTDAHSSVLENESQNSEELEKHFGIDYPLEYDEKLPGKIHSFLEIILK